MVMDGSTGARNKGFLRLLVLWAVVIRKGAYELTEWGRKLGVGIDGDGEEEEIEK